MSLREIQAAMFAAVSNPLTSADDMSGTLKNGRSTAEIAERIIKPNDRLTSFDRLEIYNRQYWFRLIDCLYDDFPGLKLILGNQKFYALTKKYINAFPSRSFTLRDLGSNLLNFVDANSHLVKPRLRAAREMIQFEWAQTVAFDTAGYPRFDPTKVAMNSETLTLKLQPYITLLAINYPFDDVLLELKEGNARSSEAAVDSMAEHESNEAMVLPKTEKVYVAVHRLNNSLYYKRMTPSEYVVLTTLHSGDTLQTALERAQATVPQDFIDAAQVSTCIQKWFTTWTALGWFYDPASSQDQSTINKE